MDGETRRSRGGWGMLILERGGMKNKTNRLHMKGPHEYLQAMITVDYYYHYTSLHAGNVKPAHIADLQKLNRCP